MAINALVARIRSGADAVRRAAAGDQTARRSANKTIGRRILVDVWGEGMLAVVDELLAPGYVDHAPQGPEPRTVQGPEGLKEAVRLFRAAFPDLEYRVDLQVAEGDLVATRFTASGTHLGEFQGIPPTGTRITYTGVDVNRIVGGKIVEAWVNYDALGLLQQIGTAPGSSTFSASDLDASPN